MNHYGVTAQRHWERWLPTRYAAIQDPDSFFSTLGEEVATRIADLTLDLAGDDPPSGGLPGQGGPAEHGPAPGGGDRPARAGPAPTGTGSGPGDRRRRTSRLRRATRRRRWSWTAATRCGSR